MFFIYAGHSYLLSPLYQWKIPPVLWNVWVPLLVLPVMVLLGRLLARWFPRTMACLLAQRWM
jgi:hypothetical protein